MKKVNVELRKGLKTWGKLLIEMLLILKMYLIAAFA